MADYITDPNILSQLEGDDGGYISDPNLLSALEEETTTSQTSAKGDIGESFKRASSDFMQAADMILSIPGVAVNIGEKLMLDIVGALKKDPTPIATANKISEEISSQGWRKFSLSPLQTISESLGIPVKTEGTVVGEFGKDVGELVEKGSQKVSEKTGSSELGEFAKQAIDIGELVLGAKAVKYGGKALKPGEVKTELPTESLDDILSGLRDEQKAPEQGPIDFEQPDLTIKEPESATTVMRPVPPETSAEFPRYEGGVDFDFGGMDLQKQAELDATPDATLPKSNLELAPEGAYREPPTVETPQRAAPELPIEPQQRGLPFAGERDWTPTEEITLGEEPSVAAINASGESAASMEAINRLKSQQEAGTRIVEFNPETGEMIPLVTADRVDKRAAKGKAIVQIDADGKVTMVENNSRYGNTPLENRLKNEIGKQEKLGGTGKKGFGQGGAVLLDFGNGKWFKEPDEVQKQYGASTLKNPIHLKSGDRLSGFTSRDQSVFHGYDKNGERFTMKASDVKPDDIVWSKDSNRTAEAIKKNLGSTGFGKGQRGSIGIYDKKPKPLADLAADLPKEQWVEEFKKQRPQDADLAGAAYDRLNARASVAKRTKVDSKYVDKLDTGLGLISTRLGNIHPVLERAAKANEQKRMQGIANGLSTADQFLTDINPKIRGGFNEADRATINNMLLDNDLNTLEKKLSGIKGKSGKDLGQELKNTRKVLDNLGNELYQRKIIGSIRTEYWPRVVKDYEGLANSLGYENKTALEKYINDVKVKYENRGEVFDEMAMSDAVNGFLHSRGERTTGAPYSKQRRMDKVPEELKQFYATPTESLHSYIRWSNDKIAEHDFFGKSLRKDAEGKIDLGGSINDYIGEQLASGAIKPEQMETVRKLLSARFRGGQQIAHGAIQTYKDINNLALLTDFTTTASQAFDVVPSLWVNGITPTLQSTVMQIAGRNKVDVKDIAGIMDHFAEEFVGNRKSSEYVVKAFKATGFSQMGRIAQNISTNASRIARQKEAVLGKPESRLYREYQTYFGKDFPQLVDDLKQGKKTPLTDELLFSELSRVSPISKLEKTEWGLNHPNAGGLLYALKSFVMKQADINRREVYNNFKKGDIKTGARAAAALTAYYAMSDIAYQDLKDYWANKPISDRTALQIGMSNLRMMGLDKHFSDKLANGEIATALIGAMAPPTRHFDVFGKDIVGVGNVALDAALGEDLESPRRMPTGESLKYLPFGDLLYGHYTEAGQAKREQLEQKLLDEELSK